MTRVHYTDPDLAVVYDAVNPPGADTAFYLEFAEPAPKAVLDMGCGTGWLACELAKRGHRVTGADPASGMLAVARKRPGADRVTWVQSTAQGLSLGEKFDLIIMTGHAFQVLQNDAEIAKALASLKAHLAPGGMLAFETRNPAVREWETWTEAMTQETVEVDGIGPVQVHFDTVSADGEYVTYETRFRFPDGARIIASDRLRFLSQPRLAAFLADAGFTSVAWYGDWDRSPIAATSPEFIALAR